MAIVSRRILHVLGFLSCIALAVKLIPVYRFGPFAFGYDSGFYRRYLIEPFVSFPNTPVPGLDHTIFIPRIILDIVRAILHQPDLVLYGTYIVFSLIGVFCVWYFAREYLSEKTSLYATALYVLSGIQFVAFGSFFFKETIAVPLFLFALLTLERKRYGWAALLGVGIVLTQQTTSILLICIGGLGFLFLTLRQKTVSVQYLFSGTIVLATYLLLHPHVAQKIASPPVGIFVTQNYYLLWSVPVLFLALFGFTRFVALAKQKPILAASFLVPLAFAVFHLPFYNRIYVFLDLFLIVPAALGLEVLTDLLYARARRFLVPGVIGIFAVVSVPLFYLLYTQTPPIDPSTQKSLSALATVPSGSAILTSANLLPWVEGWSNALVYTPGILKEPHSIQEWNIYWAHQDAQFERDFLQSFPKPTYVFVRPQEIRYRPECAVEIAPNLFSLESCI